MNEPRPRPGETPADGKAEHGYRNEVSWEGGKGRQPYVNQEGDGAGPPGGGTEEYPAGDRGDRSGRNAEQFEQVKKMP
jgi:hypothetical protein